ncbi:TRAP transporter substrate-binding protein [Neobacillus mesonae]|uniref:TRAP transporter substrate-binding protein n=1 Tax=Neobacillus mesonae TaxID=1193713 RepID=UPI0020405DB0|nr:DctP family TRAP transporter solute-binding subunit [Neobacillus mesonae]MCM3568478.1 DctP family TRAP transporter solute-binding subunit [Neobacillus mesonae]
MKRLMTFVTALGLFVGLVGCSSSASKQSNESASKSDEKVYELKLGHTGAPDHHYQKISEQFAKEVAEKTNGKVKISVFPSDQLGNQTESVEGVMMGTQDMVLTSDTVLSNWVPDMGILNLPFLFKDTDGVRKALDGKPGEELAKEVEDHGAVLIGWWENGFRHISNSKKEIKTPADLKGVKIRVPEGEVFIDTFKQMGAAPTPISFGELYSALQLGTVDAQENPPAHILTQKFYEVQKYVSRTGHIHLSSPLLINKNKLESLPEEYQKAIIETAKELGPVHTKMVNDLEAEQWKEIEAKGMKITDVDKQPFMDAMKPVYDKYKKKLNANIIEEIQKLQ